MFLGCSNWRPANYKSHSKCFIWTIDNLKKTVKKMDNPNQMQDMFWESSNYSGLFKKIFERYLIVLSTFPDPKPCFLHPPPPPQSSYPPPPSHVLALTVTLVTHLVSPSQKHKLVWPTCSLPSTTLSFGGSLILSWYKPLAKEMGFKIWSVDSASKTKSK